MPPPDAYAGAASCAKCHEAAAKAWARSEHGLHGRVLVPPEGNADAEFPVAATARAAASATEIHAVGMKWMQGFIRAGEDGFHRLLPRCYDLRAKTWRSVAAVLEEIGGTQPDGIRVPPQDVTTRSFEVDCSGCHSSRPHLRPDPARGRMESRWDDLAIDCEACHGPARAHVEAWERMEAPPPMPRLAALGARGATAVCARCHGGLQPGSDFEPKDAPAYVAGLGERRGMFPDGRASGQIYQYAAFSRSPCHREGGLTCVDCHDPHGPGLKPFPDLDAMCVRCHDSLASRTHTHHEPSGAGARCIECHLSRLLSGLMAHQRDHRISVPLPQVAEVPDACVACHKDRTKDWASEAWTRWWGDPPKVTATVNAVRGIALARSGDAKAEPLLRAALTHSDPHFRANAALRLRDAAAIRADPVPEVRLEAVRIAADATGAPDPDDPKGLRLFLSDPEPRVRAEAQTLLARRGAKPEPHWRADLEAALRMDRSLSDSRLVLAWLEREAGDLAKAEDSLRLAIALAPDRDRVHDDGWGPLAELLDLRGRPREAAEVRSRRADRLIAAHRSSLSDADLAARAAAACMAAGRPADAALVLTRTRDALPPGPARARLDDLLLRLREQGAW